jgi:uncharacterized membrane protein YqjE
MNAPTPIDAAAQLGSSGANIQVWFLILLGIAAVVWAVKALREDSAELRKDLKEQSKMREESLAQLIKCVDSNTSALKDNKDVLEGTRYQLKRNQETLEKFST